MSLPEKIEAFKKEVGDRVLTEEQQRVYRVFTRLKGKPIDFAITDKNGARARFNIYCDKADCGTQHILTRHYKTDIGRVTAMEILNLCDVIRKGDPYKSKAYTVYKYTRTAGDVTYRIILRLSGNGLLKSFYSDRGTRTGTGGNKKGSWGHPGPVAKKAKAMTPPKSRRKGKKKK